MPDPPVHPGGRRILEAISRSLQLPGDALQASYDVLRQYGNMSAPTLLFVLQQLTRSANGPLFAAAFGPGLTMETFTARYA